MTAGVQTALALGASPWFELKDGDVRLREFYNRHYSSRGTSQSRQIVGPGRKMVLLTPAIDALFVWRHFDDACPLAPRGGHNCAAFRNESSAISSELIVAAEPFVLAKWGRAPLYTYVNPSRIRSTNPGFCFLKAGWRRVGMTAGGHGRDPLIVLEKLP